MKALYKRELYVYFSSPMGFVLVFGMSFIMGFLGLYLMPRAMGQSGDWFEVQILTMDSFFTAFPWVAALLLPAVSMRLWAEERKSGTFEFLLSLALPTYRIVTAKYLAALSFFTIMLLGTLGYPSMVIMAGTQEWGVFIAGYIACFLLGSAFLALGMFFSSLVTKQMSAFVLTALCSLLLVAWNFFAGFLAGQFSGSFELVRHLSLPTHFGQMAHGWLKLESFIYFLSIPVFFLSLNVFTIERLRYQI